MKKSILIMLCIFFTFFLINILPSSAIDRVVYPLYSSTCCSVSEAIWNPDIQPVLTQSETSYTCKINSVCRVRQPTVNCPAKSISNLWLGYTKAWKIIVKGTTYSSTQSSAVTTLGQGIEFNEGDTVKYSGSCVNNALIILFPPIWGTFIAYGYSNPTSSSLQIESKVATLWQYPALEGKYDIGGTQYCQRNNQVNEFKDNLPKNEILGKTSAELAKTGASTPSQSATQTLLDQTRFYIGTCKRGVDKYLDLPFIYNVNPLGKYQNKDIICSKDKGIISVIPLETTGEDTYYVLKERLKNSNFCCNNQDCRNTFGSNYNCEKNTYECKEVQGYCNNDLNCQPEGGERLDANCIRKDNKFYTWSSNCINNYCIPYPQILNEVKCCPGYCALTNQVCDFSKGCYTPTTPLSECPSGMCCDGTTAKKQDCSNGLICCYETDLNKGVCRTVCTIKPECIIDFDCPKEKPYCVNNHCISKNIDEEQCIALGGIWTPPKQYSWLQRTFLGYENEAGNCKIPKTIWWAIAMIIGGLALIIYGNESSRKRNNSQILLIFGILVAGAGIIITILGRMGYL